MTMAAGIGALQDKDYFISNCEKIIKNREWASQKLKELGFEFTDSSANFIFAKHERVSGERIYKELKEKGVLVRHFTDPTIADYNRITIGAREDMERLVALIGEILKEKGN